MVVDDDRSLLTLLVETLKIHFEVVPAHNGLDALEKIERAEPDLMILDVGMPCVDGVDTCRAIRKNARFARIPVLFLSGQDQSDYIERAKDLGVHRFLQKPMPPDQLLSYCRELIAEMQPGSPPAKALSINDLKRVFTEIRPETAVSDGSAAPGARAVPSDLEDTAAVEGRQRAPARKPASPLDFGDNRPRIMAIDDDPDILTFILSVLRDHVEAFGVSDPISAIDKMVRYQPDMVILDVKMPHMSGYQLSQLLRLNRNLRAIQVMFMSSNDSPKEIAYARKLGAADYLTKPFTPNQLIEKVAGVTQKAEFTIRKKSIPFDSICSAVEDDPMASIFV